MLDAHDLVVTSVEIPPRTGRVWIVVTLVHEYGRCLRRAGPLNRGEHAPAVFQPSGSHERTVMGEDEIRSDLTNARREAAEHVLVPSMQNLQVRIPQTLRFQPLDPLGRCDGRWVFSQVLSLQEFAEAIIAIT